MKNSSATTPIEIEIQRVNELTRSMMREYVSWGSKFQNVSTTSAIYGEMIDFVNFRMETAESCLILIENSKVGDSLGLSRGLLENYLLFMLMCRGTKYFRLSDGSAQTAEKFKELFEQQKEILRQKQAKGETEYLDVVIYPRLKQHLQHIFAGIRMQDGFTIPYHYFQFQQFKPDALRLKPEDYFEYYEHEDETKKAFREHRAQAAGNHRHYLSYSALLDCLELNGILDERSEKRVQAHFTLLGQFLHPTHNAVRELHERSNTYEGKPEIGMGGRYSKIAKLLASVYCCYLVSGMLEELMSFFENAPVQFMADPATGQVRTVTDRVPNKIPYFWFIFNEAPLFDRFNWAIHHVTDENLERYGNYTMVPSDLIAFNQHILSNLEDGLRGWSNVRVGEYKPPF